MQRSMIGILSAAVLAAAVTPVLAQADAQAAYREAKAAYQAGNFPGARDLAQKAAATDTKNPEVLLLLGKAHYQLGELDEALAAWKQTLALAPQEPFAARMLEVLQSRRADVGTRIKLIEALVAEKLFAAAGEQCRTLLADKALSEAQRAAVLTLQAEVALGCSKADEALKIVREVLVLYPTQADPVQTTLLLGRAKVLAGGAGTTEGVRLLNAIASQGDAPAEARATAQWALIDFGLKQGIDAPRTAALAGWVAEHPKHPQIREARARLIAAFLALTEQREPATADSPLGPSDAMALAVAGDLIRGSVRTDEDAALVEKFTKHFDSHYAVPHACAAAAEGTEKLLALPLPRPSRLVALRALAGYQKAAALAKLAKDAKAGRLATADWSKMPKELAQAVATYETLAREAPASPPWLGMNLWQLAIQVRALSAEVPFSDGKLSVRGPDLWALAVLMPVLKADPGPDTVTPVIEICYGIVGDYQALNRRGGWYSAIEADRMVIRAVPPGSKSLPDVLARHAAVLDAYAKFLLAEQVKYGRADQADKDAELMNVQKEMLDALAKLVALDAHRAPAVLGQLAEHLRPWIAAGHWAVAEAAYATLEKALPEASRRDAELAIVRLWIDQVVERDQRSAKAGLTVARRLDPMLKNALVRCYELQADPDVDGPALDAASPKLVEPRRLWDSIVDHYKRLEYEDVAEAAIRTRPEKKVAAKAADEYAEFQLIRSQEDLARRGLERLLRQYGAADHVTMTPELAAVVDAWTKWIAAGSPASPLRSQAVEQVLGIGRLFEQHGAPEVAAGIYRKFAEFAISVPVLSQSAPGRPSPAHRAGFLAAAALESHAGKVLAKAMADRKPDEPPPAKLSAEYAAAIAAYKAFVLLPGADVDAKPQAAGAGAKPEAAHRAFLAFLQKHPQNALAGDAIRRIMGVAAEYANRDAWDVAEAIYADLAESKLSIRRPERLEFARGVCQLGHAMPEHAREVLAALSAAGLGVEGETSEPTPPALAAEPAKPQAAGDSGLVGQIGGRAGAGFGPGPGPGPWENMYSQPSSGTQANGYPTNSMPSTAPPAGAAQAAPSQPMPQSDQARRDSQLLAMIQRQEASRSARVAQMQSGNAQYYTPQADDQWTTQQAQQVRPALAAASPLTEAELSRQQKALDAAYAIFQQIGKKYAETPTAAQARDEVLMMIAHWRSLGEFQRSAALAVRFLADNPSDARLPQLRRNVARDRLQWAAKPSAKTLTRQEMLAEVAARFSAARSDLAKIVADFPRDQSLQQEAEWDAANSFLSEARVLSAVSPTLARSQFVRAARELRAVAVKHPRHPQIGSISAALWGISQELENQGYEEEAVLVWNELGIFDPLGPMAQQALEKIAQTYRRDQKRPLKAAETYLELNFIRGGSDPGSQEAVFQIGSSLKSEKRWVEALHVLETFVDSFPRHAQAGQALTLIGQIHQTNDAWQDAINAYRRVLDEYKDGQWVQQAKWSIAECTINLSRWREAMAAYRDYAAAYPQDRNVGEAQRRIEILKDLARYQELVDEKGQRKAFDAQFQIATIVRTQLSNPAKAIIEYRKVVKNWPDSYVAAASLNEIGAAYLRLGETAKAREALQAVARDYPTSPLAGAAMFMVGKSYEDEADRLATVTREKSVEQAKETAQRNAYDQVQTLRQNQDIASNFRIQGLKSAGKTAEADLAVTQNANVQGSYQLSNAMVFAQQAQAEVETLSAAQLADRQDKINAALRKAIAAYAAAAKIPGGNKADAALLQMANIYDQRLKDHKAAMETWTEIVRQFSGTSVAEDASWKLAQFYQQSDKHAQAIEAYNAFLRNYRRSPNAGSAQFAVAECYEHLGQWVAAMDSYNNYLNNFADGPLAAKAKEQINWIKTYRL